MREEEDQAAARPPDLRRAGADASFSGGGGDLQPMGDGGGARFDAAPWRATEWTQAAAWSGGGGAAADLGGEAVAAGPGRQGGSRRSSHGGRTREPPDRGGAAVTWPGEYAAAWEVGTRRAGLDLVPRRASSERANPSATGTLTRATSVFRETN